MPGRYALIVANDVYEDDKLKQLRSPTRDAEQLAEVLRDPEIGDFEVELSANEPEYLLRRRIARFFADRRRDDLLLLHFSCHGLKDDSGQLFFAAADTDVAHLDATAVSSEFVSRRITQSRSRKVIALLDCCYSGAIARGLQFRAGDQVDLDDQLGGHGRVIITASSAMEYAFEGDELSGAGNPSVFTTAVVRGLRTGEADLDQDHRISVDELYDYVCEQVRDVTPNQSPNMLSHLEGALYVARSSFVAPVEPSDLPLELRAAVDSPLAGLREGAVGELAQLAASPDRAVAAAAQESLSRLAKDDSRRVATAAAGVLAGEPAEPPPRVEERPPPPEPDLGARRSLVWRRLAALLTVIGALLMMASLVILTREYWGRPDELWALTFIVAVAAATLSTLRLTRVLPAESTRLDMAGMALAGLLLGVPLAAGTLEYAFSEEMLAEGPATIGALLILVGALIPLRGQHPIRPLPSPPSVMMLLGGAAVAVALFLPWSDGDNAFYWTPPPFEIALFGIAAVALLSALVPSALRAHPAPPPLARAFYAVLPAVGALGIGTLAAMFEILRERAAVVEIGFALALAATAAIAVAALWPASRRS